MGLLFVLDLPSEIRGSPLVGSGLEPTSDVRGSPVDVPGLEPISEVRGSSVVFSVFLGLVAMLVVY